MRMGEGTGNAHGQWPKGQEWSEGEKGGVYRVHGEPAGGMPDGASEQALHTPLIGCVPAGCRLGEARRRARVCVGRFR